MTLYSIYKLETLFHFHSWSSRQTSSMYSTKCPDCNQEYSRKDAMLRHQRQKHSDTQEAIQAYPRDCEAHPPPQRAYPPQPQQQQFVFQHPFTANISGPTGRVHVLFIDTYILIPSDWDIIARTIILSVSSMVHCLTSKIYLSP